MAIGMNEKQGKNERLGGDNVEMTTPYTPVNPGPWKLLGPHVRRETGPPAQCHFPVSTCLLSRVPVNTTSKTTSTVHLTHYFYRS